MPAAAREGQTGVRPGDTQFGRRAEGNPLRLLARRGLGERSVPPICPPGQASCPSWRARFPRIPRWLRHGGRGGAGNSRPLNALSSLEAHPLELVRFLLRAGRSSSPLISGGRSCWR